MQLHLEETLRLLLERIVLFAPRIVMALVLAGAAWIAAILAARLLPAHRSADGLGRGDLIDHPFRRGDRVSVTAFDGGDRQRLRYTTLRLDDGRTALIPNSSIFTNPLVVKRRSVEAEVSRQTAAAGQRRQA